MSGTGILLASSSYRLKMTDADEHKLSTADGHVTIIVLTRSTDTGRVHLVGDRVPADCIGNPAKRFITLLTFDKKHTGPAQTLLKVLTRSRLDAEARKLRARYREKGLTRDPRKDVYAVLDFDGSISAKLDVAPSITFQVLVLGRSGELLARWNDVPSAGELAPVMK
jgi:hypothetical protein